MICLFFFSWIFRRNLNSFCSWFLESWMYPFLYGYKKKPLEFLNNKLCLEENIKIYLMLKKFWSIEVLKNILICVTGFPLLLKAVLSILSKTKELLIEFFSKLKFWSENIEEKNQRKKSNLYWMDRNYQIHIKIFLIIFF
jgi:hypothetical protein